MITKINLVNLKLDRYLTLNIEPIDTVEYEHIRDLIESKEVRVDIEEYSDYDLKFILKNKRPDMFDVLESEDYLSYLNLVWTLRRDWVLTEGEYNYMRKVLR